MNLACCCAWAQPKNNKMSTRQKVWKLQGDLNRDYWKTVGVVSPNTGQLISRPKPYEQLEKE